MKNKNNFYQIPEQDQFYNALQLSVETEISEITDVLADFPAVYVTFDEVSDSRIQYLTKLLKGKWVDKKTYAISDIEKALSSEFINFLLITRLNKNNMIKLAQLNCAYEPYINAIELSLEFKSKVTIADSEQMRQLIFNKIKDQKKTLREVAHNSGITQVALMNYKKGSDIRVSTLLDILRVLGVSIQLGTPNA